MKPDKDDVIRLLVKKYGPIETSDEFTENLVDAAMKQDRNKPADVKSPNSFVALVITAMVIILTMIFLILQNPFVTSPVLSISIGVFMLGLGTLIAICQKHLASKLSSI